MTRKDMARSLGRCLGLASIAALLIAPFAWAGIEPQPFRTGLFGVTAGQAVRISAVNTGDVKGVINPCFRVLDATGKLLFETDGGPLRSGVGTSVEFAPDGSSPPTGGRRQLRVEVELLPAVVPVPTANGSLGLRRLLRVVPTLEVFDVATGRTVYTMPFVTVAGVDPTPF